MPTVPTLNRQPIATQQLQLKKETRVGGIEEFGGGQAMQSVTNSMASMAKSAVKIEQKEINKADDFNVLAADNELLQYTTDLAYDKDTGFMSVKGRNSFGLPDTVNEAYNKRAEELAAGLANDEQRAKFRKRILTRGASLNNKVHSHVHGESLKYQRAEVTSYVENETNAAMANSLDDQAVNMSIGNQLVAAKKLADDEGMPAAQGKLYIEGVESNTRYQVLRTQVNGDHDQAAKAYYEKYKDRFKGKDAELAAGLVKQSSALGDAQRATDELWVKSGEDLEKAVASARKKYSGEKEDQVVKRLKARGGEKAAFDRQASDKQFKSAQQHVDNALAAGKRMLGEGKDKKLVLSDVIPKADYAALSSEQIRVLNAQAADPINNDKVWIKFGRTDPKEIGELNYEEFVTKYYSKFNKTNRAKALSYWQEAVKDDGKGKSEQISRTIA